MKRIKTFCIILLGLLNQILRKYWFFWLMLFIELVFHSFTGLNIRHAFCAGSENHIYDTVAPDPIYANIGPDMWSYVQCKGCFKEFPLWKAMSIKTDFIKCAGCVSDTITLPFEIQETPTLPTGGTSRRWTRWLPRCFKG